MNIVNYISHVLYKPADYARRFDLDIEGFQDPLKRVATEALPFISMYNKPAGMFLSIFGNGSRCYTHCNNLFEKEQNQEWEEVALEAGKTTIALIALMGSFFHFTSGLFITTLHDIAQGAYNTYQLAHSNQEGVLEELMQTISSCVYLSFMLTGTLEIMVCFMLLQTIVALYQAHNEFGKERYIEAGVKVLLALCKCRSVNQYLGLIQKRNLFREFQKTASLLEKIAKGREASHLINHPLSSLQEKIEDQEVVFLGPDGQEIHLGSHFHGNGKTLVKGENISCEMFMEEGVEKIKLTFKINHAFRKQLEESIRSLQDISSKQMNEILAISGSHAESISVGFGSMLDCQGDDFFMEELGTAYRIKMEGLGTLSVGAKPDVPNLYDKVQIEMDASQTLYSLHEMLCLVDLSDAICVSTKEDIERLKMGHLFRNFFPREAYSFERKAEFFTLSLEDLKKEMIGLAPDMEAIFTKYYSKMEPVSLMGGRVRYRIHGLAEEVYEAGGRALTAALTGVYSDQEELFSRMVSILQSGMLASEVRDDHGLNKNGLGAGMDYLTGGADSVYTQLITQNVCEENLSVYNLYYSQIRFVISLEALELGSYQYHDDNLGNRLSEDSWFSWFFDETYVSRENIVDFTRKEQQFFGNRNEVMLKERLDPSFIKGVIVPNKEVKADLISFLQRKAVISDNSILGIPLDQFIRVGENLTEELVR